MGKFGGRSLAGAMAFDAGLPVGSATDALRLDNEN